MGRSGSPIGRTACSEGDARLDGRDYGEGYATQGTERKKRPPDKAQALRTQEPRESDETPQSDERKASSQR